MCIYLYFPVSLLKATCLCPIFSRFVACAFKLCIWHASHQRDLSSGHGARKVGKLVKLFRSMTFDSHDDRCLQV